MTVADAMRQAAKEKDAKLAGQIADQLRLAGWTYQHIVDEVHKITGMSQPEWDELLYESEWNSNCPA